MKPLPGDVQHAHRKLTGGGKNFGFLGGIHKALGLADDDRMRSTGFDFAPGGGTGWHVHGPDNVITALSDCSVRIEDEFCRGRTELSDPFFQPVSGAVLPRFAGIPSFMRLPVVPEGHERRGEVELGLFGMPWDGGTSNRPGARHGPRALRDASSMLRAQNGVTGLRPFETLACADLGDVGINPVDQGATLAAIEAFVAGMAGEAIRPLGVAGDHLCTLPVLRGLAAQGSKPGLVLLDSHTDLYPPYFGSDMLTHGNPFRQAVTEGLIDPARSVMIGMRGTCYDSADRDFAREHGITIVPMDQVFDRGIADVAVQAKTIAGTGPCYLSFDIDFIDPAFAPGTGTPEVGGPSSAEAIAMLRSLSGLNLVGADLVEVSPPFDVGGTGSGVTAWLGASVLFEILCLMAAPQR